MRVARRAWPPVRCVVAWSTLLLYPGGHARPSASPRLDILLIGPVVRRRLRCLFPASGTSAEFSGRTLAIRMRRHGCGASSSTSAGRVEPHQRFAVNPGGGDGGVQGELGARSIMDDEEQHSAQRMPSPVPKRSVMVSGHKTSVSLEEPFWQALREIATARGLTVRALISLVDEKREQGNLSSALRVFVLEHFRAACQKEIKA